MNAFFSTAEMNFEAMQRRTMMEILTDLKEIREKHKCYTAADKLDFLFDVIKYSLYVEKFVTDEEELKLAKAALQRASK